MLLKRIGLWTGEQVASNLTKCCVMSDLGRLQRDEGQQVPTVL
jgi:hypothetical protein